MLNNRGNILSTFAKVIAIIGIAGLVMFNGYMYWILTQHKNDAAMNMVTLKDQKSEIDHLKQAIEAMNQKLEDRNDTIADQKRMLDQSSQDIKKLQASVADLTSKQRQGVALIGDRVEQFNSQLEKINAFAADFEPFIDETKKWQNEHEASVAGFQKQANVLQKQIKGVQDNLSREVFALRAYIEQMDKTPASNEGTTTEISRKRLINSEILNKNLR